jgi:imidazolonepropionase-like amidohydrolase
MVTVVLLAAAHLALAAGDEAKPTVLAIQGGTVVTVSGETIAGGTVLISDGKITAVGREVAVPEGAERIDATGKTIIPGLIDALSALYLSPQELAEGAAIAPEFRVTDGLDTYAKDLDEVLSQGVTTAHVAPGSRGLLAGESAVVKVAARPGSVPVVLDPVAVRGQIGVPDGPTTSSLDRLGTYASIREALLSARDYEWALDKYEREFTRFKQKTAEPKAEEGKPAPPPKPPGDRPERPKRPGPDYSSDVLLRVLRGELPLLIEAHRVADILNALRLKDEFGVRLILLGGSEAHKIAGEIARRDVPVIIAPVSLSVVAPSKLHYGEHARSNAAQLARAGVKVALGVGGDDWLDSKFLRASAAAAAAEGLSRDQALRGATLSAAEILGVASRIGSIAEGKDADLAVIAGDPLDLRAPVDLVLVDGKIAYERRAQG